MIQIITLMAVVLHGNTSATKGKRNSYSFQDEMSIYGTAHMARLQIEESSQLTKRDSRSVKELNAHVRDNLCMARLPFDRITVFACLRGSLRWTQERELFTRAQNKFRQILQRKAELVQLLC